MKYPIMRNDGQIVMQEPEVDCWYCGFEMRYDYQLDEEYVSGGAIAKYVGNGEFFDENGQWSDAPIEMGIYDYLVKQ